MILNYLKNNHPNLYVILMSWGLMFWFIGCYGIIEMIFVKKKTFKNYLICIAISLSILYLNDFKLDELYTVTSKPNLSIQYVKPLSS